jgi:2-keto-4-pentenoate hydratase/2-oxohepta-3-ene-1,7-dioic acid hydratase in catechol pathway
MKSSMRLYRTRHGVARADGDELLLLDLPHPDIAAVLAEGIEVARRARVRARLALAETELLAPVAAPGTIVLAGANYRDHVLEAGMPMPTSPVFLVARGAVATGPNAPIVLPAEAPGHVDYEGELALVIGVPGREIRAADAWNHVGGLTVANDVSARDVQLAAMTDGVITDPAAVARAKSFPGFKPLGPGMVTPDELELPLDLGIRTTVGGVRRQESRTVEMLFDVPTIIEAVSARIALAVGDVILTGTPSGVGLATGSYLRAGDVVEVAIDGIGTLRNPVVAPRRDTSISQGH